MWNGTGMIQPGKKQLLVIASVAIILLLRVSFFGGMGMMPQDAYYFFYSQHPALSYFDHPPAIAWILRVFTSIPGENAFAIKFADTSITLLTIASFYYFSKCFLSRSRVHSAVLLLFSTLMISILSLVSTPDIPLLLFWTLSLTNLYHAVFRHKKIYWLGSVILMGLAFDSKYNAVFLPAGKNLIFISVLIITSGIYSPMPAQ